MSKSSFDAVIAGAGFFGISLADYLRNRFPKWRILVFEAEGVPMARASKHNQARLHNGYHYPRALKTAAASQRSYQRFKRTWPNSVFERFQHVYAISKSGSHVTSGQFAATMMAVGAPLQPLAGKDFNELFDPTLVEGAFVVEEAAFDHRALRDWGREVLDSQNLETLFFASVMKVEQSADRKISVKSTDGDVKARFFFNATYGGIEYIEGLSKDLHGLFTHQATEMKLVQPSVQLRDYGITVMDGPFFSLMPYPAESCHSFSHVRYTPRSWSEGAPLEKRIYEKLDWSDSSAVFDSMVRDAQRYVPKMSSTQLLGTMKEVKTLVHKARNDGRPIFIFEHAIEGCYSVLGGKLDNVFDMFDYLDGKAFD